MNHVTAICLPTRPCEIRVAVAEELGSIWSAIVKTSLQKELMATYCQLVLNLLQDSDIDVRTCAATAVATVLPSTGSCTTTLSYVTGPPTTSADTRLPLAAEIRPSMPFLQ